MDRRILRLNASAALMAAVSGCSLFDPQVGADQAACGEEAGGASGGGYGSNPNADAGGICGADAGSPCDDCESAHCCATRLACYGDPVCHCADQALDSCLDLVSGDDAAPAASDSATRCWNLFSASGHVAQARVSCERAWCQDLCGIP
jgi:hypothetical protein